MTCPMETLPEFFWEHWDVQSLCALMECPECTAEDGEGMLWDVGGPLPPAIEPVACDDWDIPF